MSKITDSLDLHYYRDAVQRSTECMDASSNRQHAVRREPCVSVYMPEDRCLVDGRPDTVKCDWSNIRTS